MGEATCAILSIALIGSAALGQTLRSQTTWGGEGADIAHGVVVAGDGSSYVVGLSDSFSPGRGSGPATPSMAA